MRFLIPDDSDRLPRSEDEYWTAVHRDNDYGNVCSLTDDDVLRNHLVSLVDKGGGGSVLIPGCGSRTALQNAIAETPSVERVVCSDFQAVVDIAKDGANHAKIEYVGSRTELLPYEDEFDFVVIVNSILSASDRANREQLEACGRALKNGGHLIGFFPTIFAALDLAVLGEDPIRRSHIDLENSTKYEPAQDAYQVFYTPLRLRLAIREAKLRLEEMSVYFLDSPYFVHHGKTWREYVYDDDTLVVYELFVKAQKAF